MLSVRWIKLAADAEGEETEASQFSVPRGRQGKAGRTRQDGIELAQVREAARELEREGVEGVCEVCERVEVVGRCDRVGQVEGRAHCCWREREKGVRVS